MSCEIIADISCNHGGDMDLARRMIDAAAISGATYAKFQTWKVERLRTGDWDNDGRRELYRQAELSEENHNVLKNHCEVQGIRFLTSCFSIKDLEFIRSLTSEVKIPSPECSNYDLVYAAIDSFDKVIISTGASKYNEYALYASYDNVFLLHCVSCYPCLYENVNMNKMDAIHKLTPRYGYSGHGASIYDAILAISRGAQIVEKHFTIDHDLPFRDNKFAILPSELNQIVDFAEKYDSMMQEHGVNYQPCEQIVREGYTGRWQ